MERPTIDNTNAVFQAGATIGTYLTQAIEEIDGRLGEGFARNNPLLLAECVRSQTMDFNSTALNAAIYELSDAIREWRGGQGGMSEIRASLLPRGYLRARHDEWERIAEALGDKEPECSSFGYWAELIESHADEILKIIHGTKQP